MKNRKKTLLNLLLIAFVLSFFVTPLGHYSKIWLMQLFAYSPEVIAEDRREPIGTYQWQLKDPQWEFFNFDRSEGKVVLIDFWASWRLPCLPELKGLQALYDDYGDRVDFYLITDEERAPVEAFMAENGFTFPVTYLIIGEPSPVSVQDPPRSYLIDKKGYVVVAQEGMADWDTRKVRALLDELLRQ